MKDFPISLTAFKDYKASDHRLAISAFAYLALAYFVGVYAIQIAHGGNGWKTGDWLINFEGGPVRRGLSGEFLFELYRAGFPLLWASFVLQASIYAGIAFCTLKLFFAAERNSAWLLIIFSPAFIFLFPAYDLQGGFRKEIIVFLAFCLMAVGLKDQKPNHPYLWASLLIYGFAVFSHELAALCLPFFIYLLHNPLFKLRGVRPWGFIYIAGFSSVAVAGLLFAVTHAGSLQSEAAICDSLVGAGINSGMCGGAILRLSYDSEKAMQGVVKDLVNNALAYPLLMALAALPFWLTDWAKRRWIFMVASFLCLLPLFVVAGDWGRWLHIYFVMLFITLLLESLKSPVKMHAVPLLAVALYAALWSIPHCCATRPGFGAIETLMKLRHTQLAEKGS